MRVKKFSLLLLLVSLILTGLVVLNSCKKKPSEPPPEETIISDKVHVLADTTMNKLDHQEGDSVFYFNQNAQELASLSSEDIIISTKEEGLLRKVKSVSQQGNFVVIKTNYTTLEDVIKKGKISLSHYELSPQQMEILYKRKGVNISPKGNVFNIDLDYVLYEDTLTGLKVRVYGNTVFGAEIDTLGAEFEWGFKSFIFIINVFHSETLGIEVSGNCTWADSIKIATFKLPTFIITVGVPPVVVPVTFTPYIDVYVGADLRVNGYMNLSVNKSDTLTGGVTYEKGEGWSVFSDYSQSFGFTPPSVTRTADAKAFAIVPDVSLRIYDIFGPATRLKGYGRIHVEPLAEPWWNLYAGLSVQGGVKMEILGWGIEWWGDIYSNEWEIANSGSSGVFPDQVVDVISVGDGPDGIAILPNGEYVYVVNSISNDVTVIQTSNNTVIKTVSVGNHPAKAAATSSHLYVTNWSSNTVTVIRTSDNSVETYIPVGNGPGGIAVTPGGDYAYVANNNDNTVSVIQASNYSVIKNIQVGSYPEGIVVTPDGSHVYVTNWVSDNVSVIRTSDNSVEATVSVGDGPNAITVTPIGDYVYVTNYNSNNVSVIRTSDNYVVNNNIPVGSGPWGVGVLPSGNYVYVTNTKSNNVSVIRTSDNVVVDNITVGSGPGGVVITPNGLFIYEANYNSDNVTVIGY